MEDIQMVLTTLHIIRTWATTCTMTLVTNPVQLNMLRTNHLLDVKLNNSSSSSIIIISNSRDNPTLAHTGRCPPLLNSQATITSNINNTIHLSHQRDCHSCLIRTSPHSHYHLRTFPQPQPQLIRNHTILMLRRPLQNIGIMVTTITHKHRAVIECSWTR